MRGSDSNKHAMPFSPGTWLFMLRLYKTAVGEGRAGWHGKIQSVSSGESRYFLDWDTLIAHLREMVENASIGPPGEGSESPREDGEDGR